MPMQLSERFCETAKPVEKKQTEHFDSLVKGLVFSVSPGGTKTFYLIYSRPNGKRARVKLGRYPDLKLSKAREKARSGRATVDDGGDPVADKKAAKVAQTVSELVDDYLKRHASTKRTADAIERRLKKNVADVIGNLKVSDLHRRDITKCLDTVVDRGAPIEANRVFEDLRAMLRWAYRRGDLDTNLADGMKRPTEDVQPRERALNAGEIKAFWDGLADANMREQTRRVLRLCLVTGQRVGEVVGMERAELDLEAATWTIPAARAKNKTEHVVPLSDMALGIIRDQLVDVAKLDKRRGREPSQWVFPGEGERGAATGHAIAKALKRAESDGQIFAIPPFTPHDLRRTMATHMEGLGISPFHVGHVLNHLSSTRGTVTSKVYARYDYSKEKREALDLWADRLFGITSSGGATVVALRHG